MERILEDEAPLGGYALPKPLPRPGATHRHDDPNPVSGDEITMYLKIGANDRVDDGRFSGKGCVISQASASILTDEVKGKTLVELKAIDRVHVLESLGMTLTPARR